MGPTEEADAPERQPARRTRLLRSLRGFAIDVSPLTDSRDYRFIYVGQAVGAVGSQVRQVAIPYLVFVITHSSLMVGLVSLTQFLPTLAFALIGGTLADLMDRRKLLVITGILLVLSSAALALPVMLGKPALWYIFVAVTVAAGVQSIDAPTRRAAVPRLVGVEQLSRALALDQVTFQLGSVLGPAVAGVLIAQFSVGTALLINAFTAAVSLITVLFIAPIPPAARPAGTKTGIAAVREGLSYLKDKPVILSTFIIDINAMVFGGPTALFPALATQVFKTGPRGLGLLYAAPGAGAFVGALFAGWVSKVRRQGRAVVVAVCIWGIAIAAFGMLTRLFWLALLMLAIAGAADMFSAVFRSTILQEATPDRLRGRLSAVHFLVVSSGPRLGDVEAGTVAAVATTQVSVVSGGLAALAGAIVLAFAIPAFMRYDAHHTFDVVD